MHVILSCAPVINSTQRCRIAKAQAWDGPWNMISSLGGPVEDYLWDLASLQAKEELASYLLNPTIIITTQLLR